MKSPVSPFLLLLLPLVLATGLSAQATLHLIVSSDNHNEDIRQGCQKDVAKLTPFFSELAKDAGMQFQLHALNFSREEVFNFFNGFECGGEDAVIFIYTGHGFRKEDDKALWPFLYYCDNQNAAGQDVQSCGVPLDWVHQTLIAKNPRMSFTIGNSCNTRPGQEDTEQIGEDLQKKDEDEGGDQGMLNLKLLTSYRGHIIASGASPGQFAYTNDEGGSYFINDLVDVLSDGLKHTRQPTTWASMLKKIREEVQKKQPEQRPQFLIVQDQKKMFSEGRQNYQNKPSSEVLNVEVPETGEKNYENLQVAEFSSKDFSAGWEKEFEEAEEDEDALANLPMVLLSSLHSDDGKLSDNEWKQALPYYAKIMDDFGYEAQSVRETFEAWFKVFREAQENGTLDQVQSGPLDTFRANNDLEGKASILAQITAMADQPDSPTLQAFLQKLK